jgi:iron complex transport system substrate-binding protein
MAQYCKCNTLKYNKSQSIQFDLCRILISSCIYGILVFLIIFQSCTDHRERHLKSDTTRSKKTEIKYAKGFDIEDYEGYRIIRVFNPWQKLDGKSITYLLVNNNSALPESIEYDIRIDIPVHRIICMSTTHVAMIGALGKLETIKGISGKQYINNEKIINGIMEGKIKDVGYEQNLNYELILSLNPDMIIMYGVTGEVTGVLNRLTSLGIPVMLNAEYLETVPLAKMEWIKSIACLYNELELATDIFQEAEIKYNELASLTEGINVKPEVLSGLPWKNTWWIPGGQSFAAAFIQDAGGKYIWEDDSSSEAIPLDIETVYDCASQADIWINSGDAGTLNDILNTDQRLQYFRPYIENRIYNNNARLNPSGGNDYWESGVINPHIILKDLIHVFHPEILPDHQLVYYKKLE